MVLEKYSKADLKKIVALYNLGLDEKILKQKKMDLIKDMKDATKKDFDEDEIDRKLKRKESTKSDPKDTHRMKDGTLHTGKVHSKDSKVVKEKKKPKLIIKKKKKTITIFPKKKK